MIEEPHYNVPLTLFTANAQSNIPAAYRRPGRVDQIIKMGDPDESQIWMNVQKFAEMEKVDLTEINDLAKDTLCDFMQSHSESHVVELLRRYKVEGWDYTIPPNDISFGETMSRSHMENLSYSKDRETI
jgi:SpoVK/Ycf46/Vps4 family AAA+-type ATPase